jgi:hypothetical protein
MVHTVIPALRRLRLEDLKVESSLGYIPRPCFKRKKEKNLELFGL